MSLTGTDHCNSKLCTNIQCKKNKQSVFRNVLETLPVKKNYISGKFQVFKNKLQIIHEITYAALFLAGSNNCFFIQLVPYIPICFSYFLILCFYFHLLFHSLLATRHILQFTMFDSILLQPGRNILEIRNTSWSSTKKLIITNLPML